MDRQLERRANFPEQPFVVLEDRVRIEAFDSVSTDDLVSVAGAVSPGEFLPRLIPKQQVPVVRIKMVEIAAASGAFAGGTESHFAKSA